MPTLEEIPILEPASSADLASADLVVVFDVSTQTLVKITIANLVAGF
jgi:hypothetical protein